MGDTLRPNVHSHHESVSAATCLGWLVPRVPSFYLCESFCVCFRDLVPFPALLACCRCENARDYERTRPQLVCEEVFGREMEIKLGTNSSVAVEGIAHLLGKLHDLSFVVIVKLRFAKRMQTARVALMELCAGCTWTPVKSLLSLSHVPLLLFVVFDTATRGGGGQRF